MLTDKMVFSDAQAITVSGTTTSSNTLDTENATPNLGAGTPIWVNCIISTSFTCLSAAATLQGKLMECATSGGTFTILSEGLAYSNGEITKGTFLFVQPLPAKHKRYLQMQYANATGSGYSAGNIDAYLSTVPLRT